MGMPLSEHSKGRGVKSLRPIQCTWRDFVSIPTFPHSERKTYPDGARLGWYEAQAGELSLLYLFSHLPFSSHLSPLVPPTVLSCLSSGIFEDTRFSFFFFSPSSITHGRLISFRSLHTGSSVDEKLRHRELAFLQLCLSLQCCLNHLCARACTRASFRPPYVCEAWLCPPGLFSRC